MLQISYLPLIVLISIAWCLIRIVCALRRKRMDWKRELQLLLVYVCIVVVARFTFFPFATVNGKTQPLVFDCANAFPFRINWIPFVNLLDYPTTKEILLNIIGNSTMFIPVGIIWPIVYKDLDTHKKVLLSGFCFSLIIEILQLPFYDRVTDVDDLILNMFGFVVGYLLYLLAKAIRKHRRKHNESV